MAGWSASIGNYSVYQMNYFYDGIKTSGKNLLKLQNQKVDIVLELNHGITSEENRISVSITDIGEFEFDKDTKKFEFETSSKYLRTWLWNYIKKNDLIIKIPFRLNISNPGCDYNLIPRLYLNSEIENDKIIATTTKKDYIITDLSQLDWCEKRGFVYDGN